MLNRRVFLATGAVSLIASRIGAAPVASSDWSFAAFLEQSWAREVVRNPELATLLGLPGRHDRWNDKSDRFFDAEREQAEHDLAQLEQFPPESLARENRLSHAVMQYRASQVLALFPYRFHRYVVRHHEGDHANMPTLLIAFQKVGNGEELEAYLTRLEKLPAALDQLAAAARFRAARGFRLPKLTFPRMIESCRRIVSGAPFGTSADSPLWADAKAKIASLKLAPEAQTSALRRADSALRTGIGPAYERFIANAEQLARQSPDDHGVGALPDGRAYYDAMLKQETTLGLDATQVHALGLDEVARLRGEMNAVRAKLGFKGDLAAFLANARNDPANYYPDTDEGRAAYLTRATALGERMRARLPELFGRLPKAPMVVRRVEPFREASSGTAFYNPPAIDGSRPGIFYANLFDMKAMPKMLTEALLHHEGIPGHHMQVAIAQELEDLPSFRRYGDYTAFSEGWALYAEKIPKEIGLYEDPLSDFGRLSLEIRRAVRLVVDTGIHALGWSRQKAVEYMAANTIDGPSSIDNEIDRYFVTPGQATSYKIGMIEILRMRERANARLGRQFDIRRFHDAVIGHGPLPLPILARVVDETVSEGVSTTRSL